MFATEKRNMQRMSDYDVDYIHFFIIEIFTLKLDLHHVGSFM